MDTTAAAELGMGVIGGGGDGVGFWDSAAAAGGGGGAPAAEQDAWADDDVYGDPLSPPPLKAGPGGYQAGGGWGGGRAGGYGSDAEAAEHSRGFGSGHGRNTPSAHEPSLKRLKGFGGEPSNGGDGAALGFGGEVPGGSAAGYGAAGSVGFVPGSGMNNNSGGRGGAGLEHGNGPNSRSSPFQGGLGFGGGSGTQGGQNGGSGSGPMRGRSSTGSIFFKTKLCARFRAGNCPYNSNCNFAHGMEELRKPPPGWEDLVATQEAGGGGANHASASISNQSQGSGSTVTPEPQKFHRSRPCKKYFADGTCPYGERCNFSHEDPVFQQRQARESADMNVTPPSSSGGGGGSGSASGGPMPRPPNWKTRICNKWETTGHCPFGDKCHFAHGAAELQKYGGGSIDSPSSGGLHSEVKGTSKAALDAMSPVPFGLEGHSSGTHQRHSSGGHGSQHRPSHNNGAGSKLFKGWKGPTEISTVYGDWIEDEEWSHDNGTSGNATLNVRSLPQNNSRVNEYSASKKEERFFHDQHNQQQQHEQPQGNLVVYKSDGHDVNSQRHTLGQNGSHKPFRDGTNNGHGQVSQKESDYHGSGVLHDTLYNGSQGWVVEV
ncbi:hypothetical protein O6H91_05G010900 [Diphasiastrum complanatum]|uniref:Uncharacterized protein n=1 Tax=Diphasiastrum complanatum TaxID=34168 RepID=A0ACC2DKS0_DIPCM|nr:hypothetical protein O6H91_05G010900 [Diphasiastrum complanatum]